MSAVPEDRGPDSVRVAKLDLSNPIHAGIAKNRENNPNIHIATGSNGSTISMPVKAGNEAHPKPSSKYPSFNTESEPYKPEPKAIIKPKVETPKKEIKAKPPSKKSEPKLSLQTQSQKATSKQDLRERADEARNARLAALKKK
jgi:hypothetical protein